MKNAALYGKGKMYATSSLTGKIYYNSYYKTRCWNTWFSYGYKIIEFCYNVLIIYIASITQAFLNEHSITDNKACRDL